MFDNTIEHPDSKIPTSDQMLNTIIKLTKNGYEVSFHNDPLSGLVITFRNRAGGRMCRAIPYENLKDSTIAIPFHINDMMYRLAKGE